MKRHLQITSEPIDEVAQLGQHRVPAGMGAVVRFVGCVRDSENGETISGLEYEAFREMAEHQFNLLFDQMEERWPVDSIRLVHRVGFVPAAEPSLWVEVVAPHRGEAFT